MRVAIVSPRTLKLEAYAAARIEAGDEVSFVPLQEPTDAEEIVFSADDPAFDPANGELKRTKRVTVIGAEATDGSRLAIEHPEAADSGSASPRASRERRGR